MEVLDSKGQQKKVQVVNIDRKVEPSSTTVNNNYRKASEFASKNNTNDLFQAAVISEKLNKRIADNIKEGEKNIAGLENPGELVRWAYDAKKGDVSAPIDFGNKIVVAVLADVREKGIAPLEQVRDQVVAKVIQQKKAEMFSKEFEAALAGGAAIDAVGAKMKLPVETAENVNFNTNAIPGSSSEPKVMGVVSALKAKTMSKPIAGKEGVFLVFVESVTPAAEQKDYKAQQTASQMQIAPRADYEPYEALKEKAEISEHLSRFPFGS
jgi:peptidyl-prolyl cis-trans isomerase D